MIKSIKNILNFLSLHKHESGNVNPIDNHDKPTFTLLYKDLVIGVLSFDGELWSFAYSEAFKNQVEIAIIPTFPNKHKEYKSEVLWPFFQARIPSIKQPKIQEIIKQKGILESDLISLLKTFGKRSINNPFILQY